MNPGQDTNNKLTEFFEKVKKEIKSLNKICSINLFMKNFSSIKYSKKKKYFTGNIQEKIEFFIHTATYFIKNEIL